MTAQRHSFVEHYLACLTGAKAARLAGYSPKRARQEAYELLRVPEIAAEIERRLTERWARERAEWEAKQDSYRSHRRRSRTG